ncbi:MAG TPA: hypothetical protein VMJ31_05115 [Methylocystis sp.]|nr:hypothetical protein [Methylocystis sp.]
MVMKSTNTYGGCAALVLAFLVGASQGALAQTVDDPLHGYCAGAGQCVDNGTNSPTSTNPPSNFGFTVSPGPASGDFVVDLLTPNNSATPGTYQITGSLSGTATLVNVTAWTSGDLAAYLGIGASPANPIGAYLPSTQALDPGATGFFVRQVDLGQVTLNGPSNPNLFPLLNLDSQLPVGSYIVAFLNEGTANSPNWIATANSGAILETAPGPTPGAGLAGLAFLVVAGALARMRGFFA